MAYRTAKISAIRNNTTSFGRFLFPSEPRFSFLFCCSIYLGLTCLIPCDFEPGLSDPYPSIRLMPPQTQSPAPMAITIFCNTVIPVVNTVIFSRTGILLLLFFCQNPASGSSSLRLFSGFLTNKKGVCLHIMFRENTRPLAACHTIFAI